jgi:hypothetical protein
MAGFGGDEGEHGIEVALFGVELGECRVDGLRAELGPGRP